MSQLNFTAVADGRELVGMVYEQEVFDDVVIAVLNVMSPGPRTSKGVCSYYLPGGYAHFIIGGRDAVQSTIGSLWRTRRTLIRPGRRHLLIPEFTE